MLVIFQQTIPKTSLETFWSKYRLFISTGLSDIVFVSPQRVNSAVSVFGYGLVRVRSAQFQARKILHSISARTPHGLTAVNR